MIDSGSSVSLVKNSVVEKQWTQGVHRLTRIPNMRLVTASGDNLPTYGYVQAPVIIGKHYYTHEFIVVNDLVAPLILGTDFLSQHALVLDYTSHPVSIYHSRMKGRPQQLPLKSMEKVCTMVTTENSTTNVIDHCAIPIYSKQQQFEIPDNCSDNFASVVKDNQDLFVTTPGITTEAYHSIVTVEAPVKIPPRHMPAFYKEEVEQQLKDMLERGIIEESSSPWMAPAVYTKKKSGELRICVDYRELNKRSRKDSYPLPLVDKVQNRLAGCTVFSTLDLQSGFWQIPVKLEDREKTAFCPGAGLGLYQFCRMPFKLTNAPSTFQRMIDKIFRDLKFVSIYIDDIRRITNII